MIQDVTPDRSGARVEMLRGGDRVLIRPIHPHDIEMERKFIEGLSVESRRFRFLESMPSPSDALLRQLTMIDPATDVAYVAVIDDESQDHEVGVGRLSAQLDGSDCEFAIAVTDAWQKKGLGTLLMRSLISDARQRGITRMHSSDASDNHLMRRFAAHLNLDHRLDPDDTTQVLYSVELTPSSETPRSPNAEVQPRA